MLSYGDSVSNRAKAWAAAGSDARMNGCELPVVINTVASQELPPMHIHLHPQQSRLHSGGDLGRCELPVVINSGSGNQGLTASLPVIVYARELGVSQETLYRALLVSNLVTIHLKTGIGCLSASGFHPLGHDTVASQELPPMHIHLHPQSASCTKCSRLLSMSSLQTCPMLAVRGKGIR